MRNRKSSKERKVKRRTDLRRGQECKKTLNEYGAQDEGQAGREIETRTEKVKDKVKEN